jgi:hypothetical protein
VSAPQEMDGEQQQAGAQGVGGGLDVRQLLENDEELAKLHEERVATLKAAAEKRAAMSRSGHGSLQDVPEADFLEVVTQTRLVVAHFYHCDFERCKVMDKHLALLAARYFKTRFIKISAPVRGNGCVWERA